ncbi:GATA zinc finger domain-containing protein 1-like [Lineus longissimus]|uniref:GATA zinc finger domain-containing protein 1-like n=1 Tax=Lineus longissimus TaxID=88925 RepID=UPI00315DE23F
MPFGVKPICATCKTNLSTMWRKGPQGEVLCNSCGLKHLNPGAEGGGTDNGNGNISGGSQASSSTVNVVKTQNGASNSSVQQGVLRKSARLKPTRHRHQNITKGIATKGKSRRVIFKKNPIKSPNPVATVVTSDWVFYKGTYFQAGDIVSLLDEDGGVYYGQIRGFLQDQFLEKSAIITWLLPTQASPRDVFDPSTYILGPEEDLPRKLEYLEFVCHAPSEYFKSYRSPYPTVSLKPDLCFIWTNIGPDIRTIPTTDEIFGPKCEEILPGEVGPRPTTPKKVDLHRKSMEKKLDIIKMEIS